MRSTVLISLSADEVVAEMKNEPDIIELLGLAWGSANEVIDDAVRLVWSGIYEPPYDSTTLEAAIEMTCDELFNVASEGLERVLRLRNEADESDENMSMLSHAINYLVSRAVSQIYYALKGLPAKLSPTMVSSYDNHTSPILTWKFEDA